MVRRFFGLLLVLFVYCDAKRYAVEKLKLFKVAKSDELCKRQFNYFLESLRNGEKWASESKVKLTPFFVLQIP